MSYILSNFYQNPPPPYGALVAPTTESFDTVPGWGIQPHAAGPPYIAVGQAQFSTAPLTATATIAPEEPTADEGEKVPWWALVLGAGVLGAAAAYVVKKRHRG